MCPLPPILAVLDEDLDPDLTDAEVVVFLNRWKTSEPLPQNVLVGVNPSTIDPQPSDNLWYLYRSESEDPQISGIGKDKSNIRLTGNGYWRWISYCKVHAGTLAEGSKSTLEYFKGKEPHGERTGWSIYRYHAKMVESISTMQHGQDCWFLCRLFQDIIPKCATKDDHKSENADHDDTEFLENCLTYPTDIEDQKVMDQKNVVFELWEECYLQRLDDNADACCSYEDLANEEYIEMNDILSDESSSLSENSSTRSINSDYFFDPEAVLRELGHVSDSNLEDKNGNSHLSICYPTTSDHVVFDPADFGIVQNLGCNKTEVISTTPAEVPVNSAPSPATAEMQPTNAGASSADATRPGLVARRNHSRSSRGSSKSSQHSSRLARIGRKYCCFGSLETTQ